MIPFGHMKEPVSMSVAPMYHSISSVSIISFPCMTSISIFLVKFSCPLV